MRTGDVHIGAVVVQFSAPRMKYNIAGCTGAFIVFPDPELEIPEETDKTWIIRKTSTSISIECNGVHVLNYRFSESSKDGCVPTWGGDVVDKISFLDGYDTASVSYRANAKLGK